MLDGMAVQMTVRIPDELAQYVDDRVAAGEASSRADLIARALDQMMHRAEREREMALVDELNERGEALYQDLEGLAEWGVGQPMGVE
jgi:Arc/MetJ-type ribon-helix-helix transcriptional regulator